MRKGSNQLDSKYGFQPENIFDFFKIESLLLSRDHSFKISFPVGIRTKKAIPLCDIEYIKSGNELSLFSMLQGESKLIKVGLKIGECEKILLPYGFWRIHRKYLINLSIILSNYDVNKGIIRTNKGEVIPVARRRISAFNQIHSKLKYQLDSICEKQTQSQSPFLIGQEKY